MKPTCDENGAGLLSSAKLNDYRKINPKENMALRRIGFDEPLRVNYPARKLLYKMNNIRSSERNRGLMVSNIMKGQ